MLAVVDTLRDYYAASNALDLAAMVAYFHEPVTFISPAGVRSFATHTEAKPLIEQFFARRRAMGAVRTDWAESHVKQLSDTLAVAGIGVVRFAADGREVERVGWTYLLQKTAAGWKIAVLASHPPDTVLNVDR
jgi:ketosteroid isomerase-like protein